jgi:hypothetical protein
LTGTGPGWPGIPQGYPWYSLLTDEGEYFADDEGNVDSNFESLTEDTVIKVPQTSETSSETIQTDSSSTNKPKTSRPQIIYPPASRKSTHLQMSSNNATEDSTTPIIDQDEEEETQIALTANILHEPLNKFVPLSFAEAFNVTRRHLWMPVIEKEIERWDNCG